MFFVNERRPEQSLSLFFDKKEGGAEGLCIARRQLDSVSMEEQLKDVECYWLLLREAENAIRPSDLEKIDEVMTSFLTRNRGGVVLLDGFEMLMLFNDYTKVSELLNKVKSLADSNDAAVIIPVDSRALYREDFENISSNYEVLEFAKAEQR